VSDAPAAAPAKKRTVPRSARRRSREFAVQGLYQWLLAGADIAAIETTATELQAAIRAAMPQFAQLARSGALSTPLRHRLALANAQIAAQREALFRAGSGVDQALAILFPPALAQSSVYSASGASSRGPGRVIAAS